VKPRALDGAIRAVEQNGDAGCSRRKDTHDEISAIGMRSEEHVGIRMDPMNQTGDLLGQQHAACLVSPHYRHVGMIVDGAPASVPLRL
jgi:hypothetical protein